VVIVTEVLQLNSWNKVSKEAMCGRKQSEISAQREMNKILICPALCAQIAPNSLGREPPLREPTTPASLNPSISGDSCWQLFAAHVGQIFAQARVAT